jgi:hypothetical protein
MPISLRNRPAILDVLNGILRRMRLGFGGGFFKMVSSQRNQCSRDAKEGAMAECGYQYPEIESTSETRTI